MSKADHPGSKIPCNRWLTWNVAAIATGYGVFGTFNGTDDLLSSLAIGLLWAKVSVASGFIICRGAADDAGNRAALRADAAATVNLQMHGGHPPLITPVMSNFNNKKRAYLKDTQ